MLKVEATGRIMGTQLTRDGETKYIKFLSESPNSKEDLKPVAVNFKVGGFNAPDNIKEYEAREGFIDVKIPVTKCKADVKDGDIVKILMEMRIIEKPWFNKRQKKLTWITNYIYEAESIESVKETKAK
jgi:hypothetical protein